MTLCFASDVARFRADSSAPCFDIFRRSQKLVALDSIRSNKGTRRSRRVRENGDRRGWVWDGGGRKGGRFRVSIRVSSGSELSYRHHKPTLLTPPRFPPPNLPPTTASAVLESGAKLLFGGKPLGGDGAGKIPSVYGAWEPTAVFVPLKEMLRPEHFGLCTKEIFGPFQVRYRGGGEEFKRISVP